MHEGCSGHFEDGKAVVKKLRMMGFSQMPMPMPIELVCSCGKEFMMETFETKCPACGMVYGVTPCHAHDPQSVKAAGAE